MEKQVYIQIQIIDEELGKIFSIKKALDLKEVELSVIGTRLIGINAEELWDQIFENYNIEFTLKKISDISEN